jgi:NDP-sugar pyrophosphorylase family protein
MKDIQLIIPMAGIGKRFIDAGYKDPKPLIEIDNKSMISHVVSLFPGVQDITFICNKTHLQTTNMYSTLKKINPNCKIFQISDNLKKGPVFSVCEILNHIDDDKEVIFSYCDYGTVWDFNNFLKKKQNLDGLISCYTGFHPHMIGSENYAFCKLNGEYVSEIKEKESFTSNRMDELASNGTYYFKSGKIVKKYFKKLIDLNLSVNGEYYISLVYNLMIQDGLKVGVFEIDKMLQWGTPYDLEVYNSWSKYFKKNKVLSTEVSCPKNTTLILPMAGKGSRFSENGYDIPKPLLPVNNNIMVVEAVNCLPKTQKKLFICLDHHIKNYSLEKKIKENFIDSEIVVINTTTQGQACTCKIGIEDKKINIEDPILISACDNGIKYDEIKLQEMFDDKETDIIVFSFRENQSSKNSPNSYSWLDISEQGIVNHVTCKEFSGDNPLTSHAIVGTIFFRKCKYFLDGFEKNYIENITTNNEFYVDDVLNQNIKMGLRVKVFEVENYICWGTPNDYKTYNYWKEYFMN